MRKELKIVLLASKKRVNSGSIGNPNKDPRITPPLGDCQAHLLADILTIPLMYNLALWNNFLKKN